MQFKALLMNRIVQGGIILAVIAAGVAYALWFRTSGAPAQFLTVKRGVIREEVSVTGTITPASIVQLSFESGGRVARVLTAVGAKVEAGQPLVALDTQELAAQLAQNQATVQNEQAKLNALKRGTRPEEIDVKRAKLVEAQQSLANDYAAAIDVMHAAYANANDAVRNKLNDFFSNAETIAPALTFTISNSQLTNDIKSLRMQGSERLNHWSAELAGVTIQTPDDAIEAALSNAQGHLGVIRNLLLRLLDALDVAIGLSTATVDSYRTTVNTALTNVNTSMTNVNAEAQAIEAEKATVARTQNELQLDLAGSTAEDIAAQQALVGQAQARVALTEAQIAKSVMRAPINGTVTVEDFKVGEIASAGKALLSLISSNHLEIDANVPEVDIGRIKQENSVFMTLDAFPGETFSGHVFFIDPAETVIEGVVNYKIKVSLDAEDARIKSGLTANLKIQTLMKQGVLVVPQFAIIENNQGTFVRRKEENATKDVPVVVGIRGANGDAEIISGLNEGDAIVNVGMKASQ